MKKNRLIYAKEWFSIGDNEFGFAYLGLKDGQDKFHAQTCFMFHQAVEKYLKGYLVTHNIKPERTHNLRYLCQQCLDINKGFERLLEDCKLMNDYYIPTRYPAHWPILLEKDAKEAHEIAKEVICFIKKD